MIRHASFTIEREFNASVEDVFSAFSDPAKKSQWFAGPEGEEEQKMDFRVGGKESSRGKIHGKTHEFKAFYYDIVSKERIIYAYEMFVDDVRISVSLASLEFGYLNGKTKLTLNEHGAFLDGMDNPEQRKIGTEELFDQLEKFVSKRIG